MQINIWDVRKQFITGWNEIWNNDRAVPGGCTVSTVVTFSVTVTDYTVRVAVCCLISEPDGLLHLP